MLHFSNIQGDCFPVLHAVRDRIIQAACDIENLRTENVGYELENIVHYLMEMSSYVNADCVLDPVIEAYNVVTSCQTTSSSQHFSPDLVYSLRSGRPSYHIPKETLEYYIENGFTIKEIASLIGVSEKTVVNKLKEHGLSIRKSYSQLTDEELALLVEKKIQEFPSVGYKSIIGHLQADGYRIQGHRVRKSMRRMDPLGVMVRNIFLRTYRIKRRSYNVRAPNALWHVDSNHKLIR